MRRFFFASARLSHAETYFPRALFICGEKCWMYGRKSKQMFVKHITLLLYFYVFIWKLLVFCFVALNVVCCLFPSLIIQLSREKNSQLFILQDHILWQICGFSVNCCHYFISFFIFGQMNGNPRWITNSREFSRSMLWFEIQFHDIRCVNQFAGFRQLFI